MIIGKAFFPLEVVEDWFGEGSVTLDKSTAFLKTFLNQNNLKMKNLGIALEYSGVDTTGLGEKISQEAIKPFIKDKISHLEPISSMNFLSTTSSVLATNKINEEKVAIWLASGASNPDLEHQSFYGEPVKTTGEVPGERFGCQCGVGYE